MSHRLYRMGSFAARRPWVVIATWVMVSLVVIGAASAFGRDLEDSMEVPGLDSQQALDLLASAESASAGLTAQVVATPRGDDVTFADSGDAARPSPICRAVSEPSPRCWPRRNRSSRRMDVWR